MKQSILAPHKPCTAFGSSCNADRKWDDFVLSLLQNDDEWLDYENDKKDYSGLKIEALKISEKSHDGNGKDDGEDGEEGDREVINEEGEKVRVKRKDDGGPWNKGGATSSNKDGEGEEAKKGVGHACLKVRCFPLFQTETMTLSLPAHPAVVARITTHLRPRHQRQRRRLRAVPRTCRHTCAAGVDVPRRDPTGRQLLDLHSLLCASALAADDAVVLRRTSPARCSSHRYPAQLARRGQEEEGECRASAPSTSPLHSPISCSRRKDDFEEVRNSSSRSNAAASSAAAPRLTLGNKFDALRD